MDHEASHHQQCHAELVEAWFVALWPESCFDKLSMTTVEAFPRHPELVLGSIPNLIQETELFYELQNQILKQVQDDD